MYNFQEQVSASKVLTERYGPISDYVVNAICEKYGIHVPKSAVAKMNCVQVSTYANSDDYISGWQDEAVLIDEIRIQKEKERLVSALEDDGHSPESAALAKRLDEMTPAQKISFARENGLTGVATSQKQAKGEGRTAEETAALIRQAEALPAGMRLAFCRNHNL